MRRIIPIVAVVALCGAVAGCESIGGISAGADAPQSDIALAAADSRALTIGEVRDIYENRTWQWEDGAGYFDGRTRAFTSWVSDGDAASYADGEWFLTETGRMCFRATWYAADGSADAVTCFDHRGDGEQIFQRRAPTGDWYVFAHAPLQEDDEILKLESGDLVRENYERNRAAILAAPVR
jgi:UDPglucose 6-dehydrogenase